MKNNPDDRSNNVDRIQNNIDNTIRNMELADDTIARTSDPKTKRDLADKNKRREGSLEGMRHEIKDEAAHARHSEDRRKF